jgi:hypothetical protein
MSTPKSKPVNKPVSNKIRMTPSESFVETPVARGIKDVFGKDLTGSKTPAAVARPERKVVAHAS